MEGKSEIEKRLLEYTDFTKIGRRRKGEIKDLIISLEDNEKIEYYLKLLSARLSVDDKISIINKIGKAEEYINELQKGINKLGLNSVEIKELIVSTGNIKKYLTKELCQNIDKEASKELINDILNNENYNIIYELGFDHTVINDTKIIYENLEEILTIENKSEKFDLLRRLYKNNNDIVKVDFSMLNDRYLNALGEEKISLISCYPEFANKILRLDDIRLKILGKCIDNFQDKLQTDEWTDICKKIINNIGYTYDNKYENNAYLSQEEFEEYIATNGAYPNLIKEIEKLSNEEFDLLNFDTLSKIFSEPNLYNIDSIDKVNNYEEFRINEIKKWYQNVKLNKIDQKKFYILLSIFDLGVDETEKIIDKYGECIEDIEDQDLKYFVKSIQKLMELNDEDVLDEIFYNVKPIKNVNNIEIIRQLKTEYGKMFNKDLLSIQDTIKSEEYGRNVYELAKDEDGNIKQFNVIVTTLAPFVSNTPDNYYKDWNRPSIGSQHFCACYIRRNMLAMPRIKYISYGFSSMADDALMLMGRSDISSSTQSFVSHADRREKYYSPDKLINSSSNLDNDMYNELDFRRMQNGEKKQPDYIIVFRINGVIRNMEEAQKASRQFEIETGKVMPILIIDKDECWATEKRLAEKMKCINYSIKDYKECYENTTTEEREECINRIKSFYQMLVRLNSKEESGRDER